MEQRNTPRSPLAGLIKVRVSEHSYLGEIVDISLSGLSCRLPVEFKEAQPVLVSFRLDHKQKAITTWAVPIWSSRAAQHYRIGFRFKDLDSAHHTQLADYLASGWLSSHNYS